MIKFFNNLLWFRFVKAADLTVRHHSLCKYLIELGLLSYDLAHCHPSEIAAAAICLSIALLSSTASFKDCWNNTLTFYSGYTYEHISEVVESLAQLLNNVSKSKLKAATKKYNDSKFKKIASSPELQFVKVCLDNLSKNNNFKDRPKPLYVI